MKHFFPGMLQKKQIISIILIDSLIYYPFSSKSIFVCQCAIFFRRDISYTDAKLCAYSQFVIRNS